MREGSIERAYAEGRATYPGLVAGAQPKIAEYSGNGSLLAWVRVVGRNVDQNSCAYSVRRATAKEWLLDTKHRLFESVQGQLRVEQPDDEEFGSVAQLVRSQLDLIFADCGSSSSQVSSSSP